MNPTKQELEAQLEVIKQEENNKIIKEALPYFQSFKGKCFRTRNMYSPKEAWWLYIKVLDVKEEDVYVSSGRALSSYRGISFQTDSYGSTTISKEENYIHSIEEYPEISSEEFNKAFEEMIMNTTNLLKS